MNLAKGVDLCGAFPAGPAAWAVTGHVLPSPRQRAVQHGVELARHIDIAGRFEKR